MLAFRSCAWASLWNRDFLATLVYYRKWAAGHYICAFFQMEIFWYTTSLYTSSYQMFFCQAAAQLICITRQKMGYRWECSTSNSIPVSSTSDGIGQNNKFESITFGTTLLCVFFWYVVFRIVLYLRSYILPSTNQLFSWRELIFAWFYREKKKTIGVVFGSFCLLQHTTSYFIKLHRILFKFICFFLYFVLLSFVGHPFFLSFSNFCSFIFLSLNFLIFTHFLFFSPPKLFFHIIFHNVFIFPNLH